MQKLTLLGSTSLLLLAALMAMPAAANDFSVYKWVDGDGVPQYTDRPPASADAEQTDVRSQRTDLDNLQARVGNQADINSERAAQRDQAREDADEAEKLRAQTRAERQANCVEAREQLETYETSRRLYRPGADGEREYLSDDELTQVRVDARAAVREWCG